MADSIKWFRMYVEAVDDEKLRLLAFEDRWHFIALLCCKGQGLLDGSGALTRRKAAVKLGLDTRELEEVARRLAEVGLIDAQTLQPVAWDKRQFKSDDSTDRVRAYRERMKRYGNVTETPCNEQCNDDVSVQETDTDTENTFAHFWQAYPKHKSKGQAEKAFAKLNPNEQLMQAILAGIGRATTSESWTKDGGKFIPHPATWLNAKGWEDEDSPVVGFAEPWAGAI